jgi:hypothetical protein
MAGASRFLTGLVTRIRQARRHSRHRTRRLAPEGLYRGGPIPAAGLPWLADFGDAPSF